MTCTNLTCPFLSCTNLTCPDLTCSDLTYPDLTCPDLTCPDLTCPNMSCFDLICLELNCPDNLAMISSHSYKFQVRRCGWSGGWVGGWVDFIPIIKPLRGPTCKLKTSKISTQVEMQVGPECGNNDEDIGPLSSLPVNCLIDTNTNAEAPAKW